MESILDYVKRRLMDLPRADWEPLGLQISGKKTQPRKLAYERSQPSVNLVEPYYRHFLERDLGLKALPHEKASKPARKKAA